MQVGGVELSEADVSWLEHEGESRSRTQLARGLCDRLGLVDALGRARVVSARIDLSRLARAGRLDLPDVDSPFPRQKKKSRRRSFFRVERRQTLQKSVGSLKPLALHRILGSSDPWHSQWVKGMEEHHYLGSGPLCGAQLRYVILSGDVMVAAASFSSAALKLRARDDYIGWTARARCRNRPLVISQSRFCVMIDVKNLASRAQSMLLSRIGDDWRVAYGVRPQILETFVDTDHFTGTCYKASNWIFVGTTQGRGRQDAKRRCQASIKDVWLYPLETEWKKTLCVEPVRKLDPNADWAETEWGGVDLGDSRLTKRLVRYGRARFNRPTMNLPQCLGNVAATKGAYRLLSHPKADVNQLLSEHRETTLARVSAHSVVLAIQDTTSLDYSTHPATEGLGPIGTTRNTTALGFELHSLMVSDLAGVPLGFLDVNVWARDEEGYGQKEARSRLPTEEKESKKWMRGYAAADAAAKRLEKTKVVVCGDREADMFDLFAAAARGRAELLVRAIQHRRILMPDGKVEGYLWDIVRKEPPRGVISVQVPRHKNCPARIAELELRSREVRIAFPRGRGKGDAVKIWAIAATEIASIGANENETKEGKTQEKKREPIEWLLLTTLPADSPEAIMEKVGWYTLRWQIEVFHRTLKSGCKIENRQASTAASIIAALAIDVVVAWRIMWLTKLGRETPNLPCSAFFDDIEWKALYCFVHRTKQPPLSPPSMGDAMRWVASLGGFLGRNSDGHPGPQTLWRGLERLADIALVFTYFFSSA